MLSETLRILMPTKARAAAEKMPARKPAPKKATKAAAPKLGALPEWNLGDLYSAMDAPELKRDLGRGAAECAAFEEAYKGKLAGLAADHDAGARLAAAVKWY